MGCAERFAALPPEQPPVAAAYVPTPARGNYAASAAPAAILVFVPGTQTVGSDDLLIGDPALWTAQGFEVVMPDIAQLIADRRAALEHCFGRLIGVDDPGVSIDEHDAGPDQIQ